ncbi:GNAT family N-acetyltransferase [Paenibacillus sp. BR2-3]|uniref:GNAT family N-acetyltransferase n=1 Tax=Paenibacillus sp. BR2-3 TaxID=3048494 RepID=UPI003977C767
MHGWVLRSASGYTKRANSVNPLYGTEGSGLQVTDQIRLAEQYYEDAGLKPVFKITPFIQPADLDDILAERGYSVVEPSSVRVLDLERLPAPKIEYSVHVQEELNEEWLEVFAELTALTAEKRSTLRRMLSSSLLKQGYALLLKDGIPTACGLGIIQHGYIGLYDIVTAPAHRRQGMAEQLLLGLLQWGKEQGASDSFLQVVLANQGASALYDKLGFKEIYQYWYRVRS